MNLSGLGFTAPVAPGESVDALHKLLKQSTGVGFLRTKETSNRHTDVNGASLGNLKP